MEFSMKILHKRIRTQALKKWEKEQNKFKSKAIT